MRVKVVKVDIDDNPADIFIKLVSNGKFQPYLVDLLNVLNC